MKEDIIISASEIEKASSDFSRLGSDYLFARISDMKLFSDISRVPSRLGGIMIVLTLKGKIEIDVNLSHCTLEPYTVAFLGPDCLIQQHDVNDNAHDICVLIVSKEFMRDTNLDINMITSANVSVAPAPITVMRITPQESELLIKYFTLIHSNTSSNTDEKCVKSISRCLLSATVYQMIQFAINHPAVNTASSVTRSRRSSYVREFINFVHEFHRRERSVAFYASKLCISPKYLSLIVKESTGRSAADWIDEFVILEAKNLLRFSGKNVQQIAYDLNFTNQSSFGKYFKHLTGMSPTEYQKS